MLLLSTKQSFVIFIKINWTDGDFQGLNLSVKNKNIIIIKLVLEFTASSQETDTIYKYTWRDPKLVEQTDGM